MRVSQRQLKENAFNQLLNFRVMENDIIIYYIAGESEYKTYVSVHGINSAVKRLKEQRKDLYNICEVLPEERKQRFFKSNPWIDPTNPMHNNEICLVRPYKNGFAIVREFALK